MVNFLGKVLALIYDVVSKIGHEPKMISYFAITILAMTLLLKIVMLPVTLANIKTQKIQAKMQPEMKKLEKKFKHDPKLYQQKVAELQKEMGFSVLTSCLPTLIQIFIVFALFRVMRNPMDYMGVAKTVGRNFFWIKDITIPDPTKLIMPIFLAVTQFLYSFLMMPKTDKSDDSGSTAKSMNFTMTYAMPIMFFFFARNYSAALAIYWAFGNIIEIIVRLIIKFNDEKKAKKEEVK